MEDKQLSQEKLYQYISALVQQGLFNRDIVRKLEELGVDSEDAENMVNYFYDLHYAANRKKFRRRGLLEIILGGFFLFGSLLLTICSVWSAFTSGASGLIVVWFGGIILGALLLAKGIEHYNGVEKQKTGTMYIKYCPNVKCPTLVKTGQVEDYQNFVEICFECGTKLKEGLPSDIERFQQEVRLQKSIRL